MLYFSDANTSYQYLKEVLALDANNIIALNQYGLLSMRLGKMDTVIAAFEQLHSLANNQQIIGVTLTHLGLAYAALGIVEKAFDSYQ